MSREVVHARPAFREHLGLRVPERQCQLDPGGPSVAAAAEPGSELGRIDLVAAPDADLRQARACFFEEDRELLAADSVELVDRAVRLVRRRATVSQPRLADRSPDEAITELVMKALKDPPLHPQRRGRAALEEPAGDRDRAGTHRHELAGARKGGGGGV